MSITIVKVTTTKSENIDSKYPWDSNRSFDGSKNHLDDLRIAFWMEGIKDCKIEAI